MNQVNRSSLLLLALCIAGGMTAASAQIPTAPFNLLGAAISSSQINLSWTNDQNAAVYDDIRVERKQGSGGAWTEVAIVPGAPYLHQDASLIPSTDYFYRVRASAPGGFSGYSSEVNVATRTGSVQTQFASTVIGFSSEYGPGGYSAASMLGGPDLYPASLDHGAAWAQASSDDLREFIVLGLATPMQAGRIEVFETNVPGAIDTIYVRNAGTGAWDIVYQGTAGPTGGQARAFSVRFPLTPYLVDAVRIAVNSPAVTGWNEFDAIAVSDPAPLSVNPSNPGAFFFDGVNDRVRIQDANLSFPPRTASAYSITGTAITVEAWVYPMSVPAPGAYHNIVQRPSDVFFEDPFRTYGLLVNTSSIDGIARFAFNLSDGSTPVAGSNDVMVESPSEVPVGEWTHVAGTYDGSAVRLYVNSELVRTIPFSGSIGAGSTGFYVGGLSGDFFHGLIDELRIWNNTRTAAQILVDYTNVQTGSEAYLAGYWPLDTDALPAIGWTPDLTPNSNDLIVQNGARFTGFPFAAAVTLPPSNIMAGVNAVTGEAYASAVTTDGWPAATVSVVSGPAGMTYDGDTLRWIPTEAQFGNFQVIFDASNGAGSVRDTVNVWSELIHAVENDTRFDLSNRGKLGNFGLYEKGIIVNGKNGLYTSDFSIVDRNNNRFAGGLYTGANSFAPVSGFSSVPSMAAGFTAVQNSFTDAWEANRIGVSVIQTSYIKAGPPDHQFMIVDYRVVNTSGAALDDIFIQVTADFDVGVAGNNLAIYDTSLGLVYAYEVGGGTNSAAYGIQILNQAPTGMSVWTGGDGPYVRSTANLTTFSAPLTTSSDVRGQFSVGPFFAAPLDTFSVTVAYLGAPSVDELRFAAARAKQVVHDPATIVDLPVTNETEPNGSLLEANGVAFESNLRGEISTQTDVDYYQFFVPTSGFVQLIGQQGEGSGLKYRFELYNSSGNVEWSSWWYFYPTSMPYGYTYLNPGVYTLRVLHYSNNSSYPTKTALPKGSKALELELKARQLNREARILAPGDTSGAYQVTVRTYQPVLGRPGYNSHEYEVLSDNSAIVYMQGFAGEDNTELYLDYGETSAYGNSMYLGTFATGYVFRSHLLNGLQPKRGYHTRFRMVSPLGTAYSLNDFFETPESSPTWARQSLPDASMYYLYSVDAVDERTLYAAGGDIFRTTNGGLTWQSAGTRYLFNHYSYALAFWSAAEGVAVGEGTDVIIATSDSGRTWTSRLTLPTYTYVPEVATYDGSTIIAVGGGGFVARSTDFGVTWQTGVLPTITNVGAITFAGPSTVLVTDYSGNILRSTDGGATWTLAQTVGDGIQSLAAVDANTIYAGGYSYVWKSTNGGASWTVIFSSPGYAYALYMLDENNGFGTSHAGRVFSTTDGWQTYQVTPAGSGSSLNGVDGSGRGVTAVGSLGTIRRLGPVIEEEPNNEATTSFEVSYNVEVEAVLDPDTDVDYFKFSGGVGDTVEISTVASPASDLYAVGGTILQLFDALGTRISFSDWFVSDPVDGATDRLVRILPATGTYYVRISDPRYTSGIFPNKTLAPGKVPEEMVASPTKAKLLSANSTYTFRLRRKGPGLPDVMSAGYQGLFSDRVYLWARILPGGGNTTGGIEYGTTPALGSFAAFDGTPVTGVNVVNLRALLTGLSPATKYYYRPTVTNEFGTFASDVINEVTTSPAPDLWEHRPTGTEATMLNIDLDPGANFGLAVGGGGNIRRTYDGGHNWDSVASIPATSLYGVHVPWYGVAVVAGTGNILRRTTDGGASWYQPTTPYPTTGPSWLDMSFLNEWEGLVAGSGGIVLKTNDAGDSWFSLTPIAGLNLRSVQMVNSFTYVAGAATGQVSVSIDNGNSWITQAAGSPSRKDAIVFFNEMTGVVGSPLDSVVYRTTDGGSTWNPITLPLQAGYGVRRGARDDSGVGYLAAIDGTVFISTDLGATWQASPTGFSGVIYAVRPLGPGLVYAVGDLGTVFVRDSRPSSVWMYVDMRSAMQSGLFNPAVDTLTLRGGTPPLSWNGFNHIMVDDVGTGIDSTYQVSFTVPNPGPLDYKFVIRHRGVDFWERAQTTNRMAILPRGGVGYGHTFDDRPAQFTYEVGQYTPGPNVIGLWHLDEDTLEHVIWSGGPIIVDQSLSSRHGTSTGTFMVPGRHGRARFFTGADSTGIRLEEGIFYPSALPYSFTTEMWINLNQYPSINSAAIFSGGKYEAVIGISTSGRLRIGIRGVSMTLDSSAMPVELNRWVHLAMQYDGTAKIMRGFIDGQLVINNSLGAFVPGSTFSQAYIGGGPGFGQFRGAIDEVRVSDRVVDPTEFNLVLQPRFAQAVSSDRRVTLSWQPSLGGLPVGVYRMYRGPDSTNVALLDSVSSLTGQYVDSTAVNGAVYFYRVAAVDISGFKGRATAALRGTPLPIPVITSTVPARNALQVAAATNITLQFNTDLDSSSVQPQDVRVVGSLSGPMGLNLVRYLPAQRQLEIVPDTMFTRGEEVEVSIRRGLTNINGDSLAAPMVARFRTAGISGTGIMTAVNYTSSGANPSNIAAGDIDNDGDIDVVSANSAGDNISVYRNGGRGDFVPTLTLPQAGGPYGIVLTDLNGDGLVDLAVTTLNTGTVVVWENTGGGNFSSPTSYGVGSNPHGIAAGDVNGDGYRDLVTTNSGSGTFSVLKNNGLGSFTVNSYGPTGAFPAGVALADLNRDGMLDVALTAVSDGTARWFRNTGSGFVEHLAIAFGAGAYAIAVADINADGNNDIITGLGVPSNNLRIDRLNATGDLLGTSTFDGGTDIRGLGVGDFNGDGLVDLVVADHAENRVRILANNGAGSFAESSFNDVGSNPWQMVVGDLDGDGDLDVVTGHQNSSFVTVLRNNVDNSAPLAPVGITISESSGRVDLHWTANTEPDIVRYVIFRNPVPTANPARLDSVGPLATSYVNLGLTDSIPVVYYIKAVDAAGNESPFSFTRTAVPHARAAGEYGSADTATVFLLPFAEAALQTYTVDATPNGQSGISFGGYGTVIGKFGQGRSYSGSQYARFTSRPFYVPTGAFTLEAWINPLAGNIGTLVRKDTSVSSGYALRIAAGVIPIFQVFQPAATVSGPSPLPAGVWTHVAGVYTGTQLLLYVNGILVSQTAATGPLTIGTEFLGIGAIPTLSATDFYTGSLDEVRISSIARQPSEFGLQLPPRALAAGSAGTTINLSWQAGGGAAPLARYRIYRGADSTSMVQIDSISSTSYSNSDLTLGTEYFYRITAVDVTNYESPSSPAAFATTSSAPSVATVTTFSGDTQGSTDSPPLYNAPNAVVLDRNGNVYVADGGNGSIRKITPTNAVTTLATGLGTVQGIAIDSVGNLFTTDGTSHKIWKTTPAGVKTVYAGSGASGRADGDSTSATFNSPFGIVLDAQGNIYVGDRGNNMIRKITPDRFVAYIAGSPTGVAGFAIGTASNARFSAPSGLVLDNAGNLLVADRNNNAIRKLTFGGGGSITVSTVAGLGSALPGSTDGSAGVATFNLPTGVTADPSGNMYVADKDNNLLRRISSSGTVSTVAGGLAAGMVDDTASAARFTQPTGITVDGTGTLYVADWGNHRIRRVVTNYVPSVFTGVPTSVTATSGTLVGFVNPNLLLTSAYFEYGTSTAYGTQTTLQNAGASDAFLQRNASLTGLTPNTIYHSRLVATNESGTTFGADQVFTTALAAPGLPTLSSPGSAATGVSVTPSLAWTAGANAESYRLQVSLVSDFSAMTFEDSTIAGLARTVPTLQHDAIYYWRVRSQNVTGTSAYTASRSFQTIVDTPDVPTLATPADGSADQPVALTLSWNAAARATTYHLQVSAGSTFSALSFEDSTLTGTSTAVNGLANLTPYYWRVRAKNAGGTSAYSATRQFTTIIAAPADPTLATPVDSATNQPTSITLAWNATSRASSYRLQVAEDGAFSVIIFDDSTLTGTSRSVSSLQNARTYHWRMRAKNVGGTTAYTASRRFTTIINSPDVPVLAAPDSAAVNTPVAVTAQWQPAARAERYHVQLSTSNGFATLLVNDSTVTDTSRVFSGLGNDLQYFWRVRSINTGGSSAYSPVWTFRTVVSIPDVPVAVAPVDSALDLAVSLPFSWSASARATSYRLEVSTDSSFQTTAFVDTAITSTSRGVGSLSYSTQYYWRVRAQNAGGPSAYSGRRMFRTIIEAPPAPTLVGPDTLSTSISTAAQLTWRSAQRAVTYRVQVSLVQNFGSSVFDQSGITDTTLSVGLPFNDTTYYWRVSATNFGGTSSYSSVWKFRTIIAAPDAPSLATPADVATNQQVSMTFSWSPANRATAYRLEVATASNFASLFFVDSTMTGTSRAVTLAYGTQYFWRVRGSNPGGSGAFSATRSLTTIIQAPDAAALVSPDSGSTDHPTTITLTWRRSARASEYQMQLSLTSGFSILVNTPQNVPDSNSTVGPLQNDTYYFWRVIASNVGGTATSAVRGFRTVVASPAVPTAIAPADNAQNQPTAVQFSWNTALRAATYRLQVSSDAGFGTLEQDITGIATTSRTVTGLQNQTPYFWRVEAVNAGGVSGFSTVRSFTTVVAAPAAAPTLASPADNAQAILPSGSFTWNSVSGAVSYHLQISTVNTFTSRVVDDSSLTTASIAPGGLSFATNYFWRARGRNAGGSGPWSAVRSFRTAPNTPLTAVTPSPVDFGSVEAGLQTVERTITLTNNGGTSLNVSSATLTGLNAGEFSITSGGGAFSVTPGSTRQVVVLFSPATRGAKSSILLLQTNDLSQSPSGVISDTLDGFATDNTAPYNPSLVVSVTPSGWTNRLPISIAWTPNITDVSGVSNVWMSLGVVPSVGQPGTSAALVGQSFNVPAFLPRGNTRVYFYFEDGVGNRNPLQAHAANAKFDDLPLVIEHDSTLVPEVTVQSGSATPAVVIAAQAYEMQPAVGSGVKSFTLEYRRVVDAGYTSVSMLSGSFTIPAGTFVLNGGPIGVDYRLVALDSADNRTATRVYSIRVKTVDAPPPQPTPLASVAALPAGTDIIKAYRLFSVPYDLSDKRPSQVFPLTSNLGPHAQDGVAYVNWKLQRYVSGVQQNYEDFKDQQALTPGAAFFLIVRSSDKRITVGTGSVVNAQAMNDVGIQLQSGWNLVGNPLLRDLAAESLKVTGSATIDESAAFTGTGTASGWDMNPTVLKQWEGLAIKASGPTYLLFRTIGTQPGLADPEAPIGRLRAAEAVSDEVAAKNWLIEFGAYRTDNDMVDLGDAVGMVNGAEEGADRYDTFQPPFIGTRNVAVYFENGDEAMMQDIRPVSDLGAVWEMKLVTGDRGAKVRLVTSGSGYLPNPDFEAFLVDLDQKMAYNLKTTTEVMINSMEGRRNLRVVVGRRDYVAENSGGVDLYPQQFQLFANYPNPFNPETMIRYTVADRPGRILVSLRVYDMLGREVAVLVDREQGAGYYEIPFVGTSMSSGPYFYRLQVTGANGNALYARVMKMVLVK